MIHVAVIAPENCLAVQQSPAGPVPLPSMLVPQSTAVKRAVRPSRGETTCTKVPTSNCSSNMHMSLMLVKPHKRDTSAKDTRRS